MPGSTVQVWLHSTPVFLGEALAGADGSFVQSFAVSATTVAGEHHVVLTGQDPANNPTEIELAVTVVSAINTNLPSTGSGWTIEQLLLAGLLLGGGITSIAVARRRTQRVR